MLNCPQTQNRCALIIMGEWNHGMFPLHGNITCDVNRFHWQPGALHFENMPLGQFHCIKQTQYTVVTVLPGPNKGVLSMKCGKQTKASFVFLTGAHRVFTRHRGRLLVNQPQIDRKYFSPNPSICISTYVMHINCNSPQRRHQLLHAQPSDADSWPANQIHKLDEKNN